MIALFQRLPLGGKLSLEATDEGQFATERQSAVCVALTDEGQFATESRLKSGAKQVMRRFSSARPYLFPIIFCNSAINDEISLNERYTEA